MKYVPGEIIVKYKEDKINLNSEKGFSRQTEIKNKFSLESKEQLKKRNIEVFRTKNSVEDTIKELKKDENIEYAEPNYIRRLAVINTNDTYKDYLWGLDNIGQNVGNTIGTVDADVDAPASWNLSEGNGVIVAVIDSGVAFNHPDLINNMWDGSSCKDENGVFLGGCSHGFDFESDDKIPLPDSSSHGTHVAGIIAAEKNNLKGIIGVAPQAKIMALKSDLTTLEIIKAIDFSIQNGAKVINASYGDNYYSQFEYDAINRFRISGGVFVAAAGNDSRNNDAGIPFYPSDYNLDNIISVAATDQDDNLAGFSNYGLTSVDIGAPGTNILSTVPSSIYLNETFSSVVAPNLPENWTKGGSNNKWGTYRFTSTGDTVLYGQVPSWPYDNNSNTSVISPSYDLLGVQGALLSFDTACDTEYPLSSWYDYMQLQYSNDGVNFYPASYPYNPALPFKWDEPLLDNLNGDSSQTGAASYSFTDIQIPSQYYNQNFRLRFDWITDGSVGYYDGCNIDNIVIEKISDGSDEKYDYMQGTSMATPHVAGEVALVMSANPSLSVSQIKNNILWSGDYSSSLGSKILSSERINTYKAVYYSLNNDRPVYRFWSDQNQGHFYTANEEEKNYVINNYLTNVWRYEGIGYKSFLSQQPESVPLYRFWGARGGHHFYTASEEEKNYIIANYPESVWKYEGIAFYVYPLNYVGESNIIYRFWSDQNQGHFYTASEEEKNYIIANYPESVWKYEGTAYKVVK